MTKRVHYGLKLISLSFEIFILDCPPLTVGAAFDLLLFIFFFSSQKVAVIFCEKEQANSTLSSYDMDSDILLQMTGFSNSQPFSAMALPLPHFEANIGKTICLFLIG